MDSAPVENSYVPQKISDPKYKKKLEMSYIKCIDELCNPCDDWEGILSDKKFTMNPKTGEQLTSYDFELNFEDNIDIKNVDHSYIFKRSHFYSMFSKRSSRLKRDLIKCWRDRGYYVSLVNDESNKKWKLSLSWRN